MASSRSMGGFALLSSMLLLAMLAAFSVGVVYIVQYETIQSGSDRGTTQGYYAASAAMEKMVVDLHGLYSTKTPTLAEIESLEQESYRPSLAGVTYSAYDFSVPSTGGVPDRQVGTLGSGPNQGLIADITPITLLATAAASGGNPVSMSRVVQSARVPLFQFGVFFDGDLSYFSDDLIEMGARVHTNGNLYLASGATKDLVFQSRLTSAQEVIRAELPNGVDPETVGWNQSVMIPIAPGGCQGSQPACRNLASTEGSKTGGPMSSDNPAWTSLSETTLGGMVLSGLTGGKSFGFPLGAGVKAVELIRRPPAGEDPNSLLGQGRLFNQSQIRILISDDVTELPGGAGVRLANVAPYYNLGSHGLTDTAFAEGLESWDSDFIRPPGSPPGAWSLIDGYLLVQNRLSDSSYADVTLEWLNLGLTGNDPDAILKFQRLKDDDGDGVPDHSFLPNNNDPSKYLPINLYDTREGEVRDIDLGSGSTSCAIGGIMNLVELDVGNLKRWLEGATGSTGGLTENTSQNGYLLYHSDRRGNLPDTTGFKMGEYGFEDVVNPTVAAGIPDGVLSPSEDVNQNGQLDTYGAGNLGDAFGVANGDPTLRIDCNTIGRKNRVSGARHGLKLVDAALGNIPTRSDGSGGFTVASENVVYVQGNYNANDSGFQDPHAAAAVIADGVTFLSKNWLDWHSFRYPTHPDLRAAATTYYRLAVAAGKPMNWPKPDWGDHFDGLDGGVHNLIRYLEDWNGQTSSYRGSLASIFFSHSGIGAFKCCSAVYREPTRDYTFDPEFLDMITMPPGTPRLQDLVTQGSRRVFPGP